MRIDPQISAASPPPPRPASHLTDDHTVRSSLSLREKRIAAPARCDRYEPCADAPGPISYADYLEKQNRRKAVTADRPADWPADRPVRPAQRTPEAPAQDTGLGPKLGDIPAAAPETRTHTKVVTAYQLRRFAPTGALVDVVV